MRRPVPLLLALLLVAGAACPKRDDAVPPVDVRAPGVSRAAPETTSSPAVFAPAPPGARAVVVFTASVQGYVEPCGCTGDPMGGVARLAALFDEARAAYGERVFFVDGGDLLFERDGDALPADRCQAEARHALLLDTYARLGLVGTVRGPLDDVRGPEWRDALLAARGIPSLDATGRDRAPTAGASRVSGVVVERGGVKLGFTGAHVFDAGAVDAARAALSAEAARLRAAGALAVVAVLQSPRALTETLARGLDVDVVIQGHAPGELPVAPVRVDERGPVIVAAGLQAQHAGILELVLDGREGSAPLVLDDRVGEAQRRARLLDARIAQYEKNVRDATGARADFVRAKLDAARSERARIFDDARRAPPPAGPHVSSRAVALVRGRAEEPQAKTALDAYRASIPSLTASCEAGVTCPEPLPDAAVYVGAQACFDCHKEAVKQWQKALVELPGKDRAGRDVVRKVGHAVAWQTLVEDGKDRDRECVGCHSIGWNAPGGYCRTADVDFRKDVQCEACHGPGSLHVASSGDPKLIVSDDITEAVCRGCHHVPHIPTTESFVFEEKLLLILGPGHGEARRAALLGSSTTRTP